MNEINDKNTENMAPCRDCKKFKAEISRLEETNSNLLETISNLRDQLKNLQSLENPEPLVVPGPDLNWQFFDDSLEVNYIHKKDKFDNYIREGDRILRLGGPKKFPRRGFFPLQIFLLPHH